MINKELYGWVDTGLGMDSEGGWTIEGGEEAYYEALAKERLSTITTDIVIGDCDNCIHRKVREEDYDYCDIDGQDLKLNSNYDHVPTTGCPQKPQTYIFNFVESTTHE